jgi:hypothetical protein
MRLGAADYLAKPFEPEELILAFLRCRGVRAAARREEKRADEDARKTEGFLFSQGLAALRAQVETVLEAERRLENNLPPMLIERETGTGNPACRRRFGTTSLSRAGRRAPGVRAWASQSASFSPARLTLPSHSSKRSRRGPPFASPWTFKFRRTRTRQGPDNGRTKAS